MTNKPDTLPEGRLEDLAGRLSKAAKAWLVAPDYVDPNTIRSLRRRGVVKEYQRGLTPLGEQLRQSLLNQEKPK